MKMRDEITAELVTSSLTVLNVFICQMDGYLGVAKFPWSFTEGDARDSVFIAARTLPSYQPNEEDCEWGCRYNHGTAAPSTRHLLHWTASPRRGVPRRNGHPIGVCSSQQQAASAMYADVHKF